MHLQEGEIDGCVIFKEKIEDSHFKIKKNVSELKVGNVLEVNKSQNKTKNIYLIT